MSVILSNVTVAAKGHLRKLWWWRNICNHDTQRSMSPYEGKLPFMSLAYAVIQDPVAQSHSSKANSLPLTLLEGNCAKHYDVSWIPDYCSSFSEIQYYLIGSSDHPKAVSFFIFYPPPHGSLSSKAFSVTLSRDSHAKRYDMCHEYLNTIRNFPKFDITRLAAVITLRQFLFLFLCIIYTSFFVINSSPSHFTRNPSWRTL